MKVLKIGIRYFTYRQMLQNVETKVNMLIVSTLMYSSVIIASHVTYVSFIVGVYISFSVISV